MKRPCEERRDDDPAAVVKSGIRSIYPRLAINELLEQQPMLLGPKSLEFFLDWLNSRNKS